MRRAGLIALPLKATICDGDHFAASRPEVRSTSRFRQRTLLEVKMARALKQTKTRLARLINSFRKSRYYDTFE